MPIFTDPFPLTWVPTITSTMTISAVVIRFATYYRSGGLIFFSTRINFTTAGAASTFVDVSLPTTPYDLSAGAGLGNAVVASYAEGAALDNGRGSLVFSIAAVRVFKIGNVNWTLGVNRGIDIQGFYLTT